MQSCFAAGHIVLLALNGDAHREKDLVALAEDLAASCMLLSQSNPLGTLHH